jgi:hypothetical protein
MTDTVSVRIPQNTVNEGSTVEVTAKFLEAGAAETPTTVHYQVVNLSSEQTVKDWTSVSTSDEVTIQVQGTDNVCEFRHSISERFRVIVQTNRGLTGQHTGYADYDVKNFRNIN